MIESDLAGVVAGTDAVAYGDVEAFHRARRMFAVVGGVTVFAAPGTPQSHRAWLAERLGDEYVATAWPTLTRGYVLDGVLVAYRGDDFAADVPPGDVRLALAHVEGVIGPVRTIGLGVVPVPGVAQWPPRFEYDRKNFAPDQTPCRACACRGVTLDADDPGASPVCLTCLGTRVE